MEFAYIFTAGYLEGEKSSGTWEIVIPRAGGIFICSAIDRTVSRVNRYATPDLGYHTSAGATSSGVASYRH